MPAAEGGQGFERRHPRGPQHLGLVREHEAFPGRTIGGESGEEITSLGDQLLGRLVEICRQQQEAAMVDSKLATRLHDPAFAENHVLSTRCEGPTDGGPFLEGDRHDVSP
jgi:hypothetical protein